MFFKDIICLPFEYHKTDFEHTNAPIAVSVPRGKNRQKLALAGLIGKISIAKFAHPDEIQRDIGNLFKRCFTNSDNAPLKFYFLSCYGCTKVLTKPNASATYVWDGSAVYALGRSCIYIAIDKKHALLTPLTDISLSHVTEQASASFNFVEPEQCSEFSAEPELSSVAVEIIETQDNRPGISNEELPVGIFFLNKISWGVFSKRFGAICFFSL